MWLLVFMFIIEESNGTFAPAGQDEAEASGSGGGMNMTGEEDSS